MNIFCTLIPKEAQGVALSKTTLTEYDNDGVLTKIRCKDNILSFIKDKTCGFSTFVLYKMNKQLCYAIR